MTPAKRVLFNADDFGYTERCNTAIVEAHARGVLSAASLMVDQPAAVDAVRRAREHPTLAVGLHLVIETVDAPVRTGFKLFFLAPWLRKRVRADLARQVRKFQDLVGRKPTHLDGHLNLHVHPSVADLVADCAREHGIGAVRLPREPWRTVLELDPRDGFGTRLNGFIFDRLSRRARPLYEAADLAHPHTCYGVLRPFGMTEALVTKLLDRLEPGLTEIYFHPGHPAHGERDVELAALTSEGLRRRLRDLGLEVTSHDRPAGAEAISAAAPDDRPPDRAR
jgi:hypothetical protein